jgi:hypothetical protein
VDPTIGAACTDDGTGCTFSPEPGQPECGDEPAIHVIADTGPDNAGKDLVGLAACARHATIAKAAAGSPSAVHQHVTGVCNHPDRKFWCDRTSGANGCSIPARAGAE